MHYNINEVLNSKLTLLLDVGRLAALHVFHIVPTVECQTPDRESPGSNTSLLPFLSLDFVLSITPQFTLLYK